MKSGTHAIRSFISFIGLFQKREIFNGGVILIEKLLLSYLNWLLVVFASLLFISLVISDLKEMF